MDTARRPQKPLCIVARNGSKIESLLSESSYSVVSFSRIFKMYNFRYFSRFFIEDINPDREMEAGECLDRRHFPEQAGGIAR